MKASLHLGHGRAKHNDRSFDIEKAEHIDNSKTEENITHMPIKGNHFNEHLKKYCKEAGIPYYSSHKIRFYGATALFDAGVNPEQIRRIMGHTSIKMTEHYNRTRGNIKVDIDTWNKIFGVANKKPDET